jgi:hypothetical protein
MDGKQLYRYDIPVAWCVVPDDRWSKPVRIVGWFHPAEIRTQMHEELLDEPFGGDGIRTWPAANQPGGLLELLRAPQPGPAARKSAEQSPLTSAG